VIFEALLRVLGAGLSIWDSKEKTKYIDKLSRLQKEYRDEVNKPIKDRSDAVLDNLRFELEVLGNAFSASIRESHSKDK